MPSTTSSLPTYPMSRRDPFDPTPPAPERTSNPMLRVRLPNGSPAWLVTRYGDQRAVLADPRLRLDSAGPPSPHAGADPDLRRYGLPTMSNAVAGDVLGTDAVRREVARSFTVDRVEALRPSLQRLADRLIDDMVVVGPPTDVLQALAVPLPALAIAELIGIPYPDRDFFVRSSRSLVSSRSTADQSAEAAAILRQYLADLAGSKARVPTDGLVGRLATVPSRTGRLSPMDVADIALALSITGQESTANTIALSTLALLANPDQLASLSGVANATVIDGAVEEMLRFLTPVCLDRCRIAVADVEVAGHVVREGERVVLANNVGNRDETVFPRADALDVHRDAGRHLAFGYGVHRCLGQPLVRMQLRIVVSTLFRRIPTLRPGIPLSEINFKDDTIGYGVHALPITW